MSKLQQYSQMIRFIGTIVLILSCLPIAYSMESSVLVNYAHNLRCAQTEDKAKAVLESFWGIAVPEYQFPTDWVDEETQKKSLAAGTLDIVLHTLVNTAERFPNLQHQVERTFLQWNYCSSYHQGKFYDLEIQDSGLKRYLATYRSPTGWSGFRSLGFLGGPASYTPEMLKNPVLGERALEHFFHRIYRKHCFPHPDTGELFNKKYSYKPFKAITPVYKVAEHRSYPYAWPQACFIKVKAIYPPVKPIPIPLPTAVVSYEKTEPLPKAKPKPQKKITVVKKPQPKKQSVLPKVKSRKKSKPYKPIVKVNKAKLPKSPIKVAKPKPKPKPKPPKSPIKVAKSKPKPNPRSKPKLGLDLSIDKIVTLPPKKKRPAKPERKPISPSINNRQVIHIPSSLVAKGGVVKPALILGKKNKYGIAGAFTMNHSLQSSTTILGIGMGWTPIKDSYWSVRTSGSYQLGKVDDPFSYSWGIGYSDWHPGTISYQLNNYGPIKIGEGFAIDKAVASIGYGIKSETLSKLNLGLSGAINIPVKGDPAIGATLQWSPKPNWFVRAGVSKPLNDKDPSWSYGFGYSDWKSNTINMQYNNYGPNDLFDTNFIKNGSISINYKWEF